ncbi:MAG: serine/threonine protein kinase [Eggerthellaceae bacterium]|nr:serine/threonine protein kinase [Eggerthellaceae bacterium]
MSEPILHEADELLDAIKAVYAEDDWPVGFAGAYAVMECLGEGQGCDTFLVQDAEERQFVAKRYDKAVWSINPSDDILRRLDHPALPRHEASYEDKRSVVVVRTYVEGSSLDRYVRENDLGEQEIACLVAELCDVLAYLHHRPEPVIHRDIKPENVIVRPDGSVALIDFDIARTYREGGESDTVFFGTRAYAAPEQYGFSQTDCRADIYSLGVLLRRLLTGSPRENKNVRVYRPLEKVIAKCTAFDPERRYADVDQVKKALLAANPTSQGLRIAGIIAAIAVAVGLLAFAGFQIYKAATWSPFNSDAIPAVLNDEERVADAVAFMRDKHGTHLFDAADDTATVGLLRQTLIECYGLDRDYVYGAQDEGLPGESDKFFMPWGWDDGQTVRRETCVYAAVKVHDPSLVAEDQWSKLPDDNGEYPGARVAMIFADETGILTGAKQPYDITVGELALIFANADRVFDAAASSGG